MTNQPEKRLSESDLQYIACFLHEDGLAETSAALMATFRALESELANERNIATDAVYALSDYRSKAEPQINALQAKCERLEAELATAQKQVETVQKTAMLVFKQRCCEKHGEQVSRMTLGEFAEWSDFCQFCSREALTTAQATIAERDAMLKRVGVTPIKKPHIVQIDPNHKMWQP